MMLHGDPVSLIQVTENHYFENTILRAHSLCVRTELFLKALFPSEGSLTKRIYLARVCEYYAYILLS